MFVYCCGAIITAKYFSNYRLYPNVVTQISDLMPHYTYLIYPRCLKVLFFAKTLIKLICIVVVTFEILLIIE